MSFIGANCLLTLPSSKKQTSIDAGTIMDIILIRSIQNYDDVPYLLNSNLLVNYIILL